MENTKNRFKRAYSAKEKLKALNLLKKHSIEYVMHVYQCSKRSLYRWNSQYKKSNQDIKSLIPKYHAPYLHPNQHTKLEIENINMVLNKNSNIGFLELYSILKHQYNYKRSAGGLYNYLLRHGFVSNNKKEKYIPQVYDTAKEMSRKAQLDVKYVPLRCSLRGKKYYQYGIIDEATRQRFIYAYDKLTQANTIDFVRRAMFHFGYKPQIIQTDNGQEFTHILNATNNNNQFTKFCESLNIVHQRIRPQTPRHNGKIERSHRNDEKRFYKDLKFNTLEELNIKLRKYLERSNNIVMSVLYPIGGKKSHWMSPNEKRKELESLGFVAY